MKIEFDKQTIQLYDFTDWTRNNRQVALVSREDYEIPFSRMFLQIERGWKMIDVGAAVGFYTIKGSLAVGDNGTVVAIEPHPQVFTVLLRNIKFHNLTNVIPLRKAVSNKEGTISLYESHKSRGGTTTYLKPISDAFRHRDAERLRRWLSYIKNKQLFGNLKRKIRREANPLNVEANTLDNITEQLGLEAVHLIKIDVQGAEYEVLQGATDLLDKNKPILLVEVHQSSERRHLLPFLHSLDYHIEVYPHIAEGANLLVCR